MTQPSEIQKLIRLERLKARARKILGDDEDVSPSNCDLDDCFELVATLAFDGEIPKWWNVDHVPHWWR